MSSQRTLSSMQLHMTREFRYISNANSSGRDRHSSDGRDKHTICVILASLHYPTHRPLPLPLRPHLHLPTPAWLHPHSQHHLPPSPCCPQHHFPYPLLLLSPAPSVTHPPTSHRQRRSKSLLEIYRAILFEAYRSILFSPSRLRLRVRSYRLAAVRSVTYLLNAGILPLSPLPLPPPPPLPSQPPHRVFLTPLARHLRIQLLLPLILLHILHLHKTAHSVRVTFGVWGRRCTVLCPVTRLVTRGSTRL